MAAIDNLAQAVTDAGAAITNAIAAGIGAGTGVPEADVQAQADLLNTATQRLVAATPAGTTEPATATTDNGGADEGASVNPPA